MDILDEQFLTEVGQRLEATLRFRHRMTRDDAFDAAAAAVIKLYPSVTSERAAYGTAARYAGAVATSAAEDFRRTVRVQRCQGAHLVADEQTPGLLRPKRQVVAIDAQAYGLADDTDVARTVMGRLDAASALSTLRHRDRRLVWSVKAEQRSVSETAEHLGLSREHASRLLTGLMAELHQQHAATAAA